MAPAATAIGYARVSTEGQATEGVSLDAQRAKIEAWCNANDCRLAGIFVDAGLSGGRADNRPELQKALAAVCEKPRRIKARGKSSGDNGGRVLIVYSLSRLARSVRDTIQIADRLDKAGADMVSLSEKIDTTSAAGRMVFRMLAVLAEFERDLVSERTSAALQHMRSQNKRVGGVPYGWDLSADGVTLTESPAEQQTINEMVAWRQSGLTLQAIADRLIERKIVAKSGKHRWHSKVVMDVIRRYDATAAAKAERRSTCGRTLASDAGE